MWDLDPRDKHGLTVREAILIIVMLIILFGAIITVILTSCGSGCL